MIHLDTNYLIGSVSLHSPHRVQFLDWFQAGEEFSISAIAWSEFLNGPTTANQVQTALTIVDGRILSFGAREAEMAASLFNRSGRRRGSQSDCFIAATALVAGKPLATVNRKDFTPFVAAGLRLI